MKRQPNKWLIFSSLFIQIAIVMYLMVSLGFWIESKIYTDKKIPTFICSVIGVISVIFMIKKQTKNF
ncbi:MAG: hypothetical protein CMC57_01685 [Flavobacteriaceae bacterium]|nr:hypothetical protein [Flavobacteriaceae bacterium]